ncbi:MAG: aminopeptidase [Bacteriovoracaceae bacterium]|nr:aminopeptidase [Bacteriovoracaceae bacterium]
MKFLIFLLLLSLSSCAKFGYLWEQGWGQMDLLWDAEDNEDVLKDEKINELHKLKIRLIQDYKKYFYDFYNKTPSEIYTETTFLNSQAVTYLVIASPHNYIKAHETSFPFYGKFPYLGFFKKRSAEKYREKMHEENYVTYMRPVYAYSTLGAFEDPILSSFFYYSDFELANLIFHELFHTILFVKNDVEFNENIATYFAEEMQFLYFEMQDVEIQKAKIKKQQQSELKKLVVSLASELNQNYKKSILKLEKSDSEMILNQFLEARFFPEVKNFCKYKKILSTDCFPLQTQWNNAVFAAFMTYEKEQDLIEQIRKVKELSLIDFFIYLEKEHKAYQDDSENDKIKFSEFLTKRALN